MYEFGMKFACHLVGIARRTQKQVARSAKMQALR